MTINNTYSTYRNFISVNFILLIDQIPTPSPQYKKINKGDFGYKVYFFKK